VTSSTSSSFSSFSITGTTLILLDIPFQYRGSFIRPSTFCSYLIYLNMVSRNKQRNRKSCNLNFYLFIKLSCYFMVEEKYPY
jgi:hypothetical protein